MDLSHYGAKIFLPGEVFASNSATQASTIVYKTLNNILTLEKEGAKNKEKNGRTKFKSGSSIVSATILPRPVNPMRKPIKFVFYHKNKARNISTSKRTVASVSALVRPSAPGPSASLRGNAWYNMYITMHYTYKPYVTKLLFSGYAFLCFFGLNLSIRKDGFSSLGN